MTTIDYLLQEDGSKILLEGSNGALVLESTVIGTAIANANAFTSDQSGYTICDRTGKRVLPGALVKDPFSGGMVLPKYADEYHPEKPKTRSSIKGSERPEQDLNWITTPITSDDL